MTDYWGVDSARDSRTILPTLPRIPDFWLRYLPPDTEGVIGLSKSEIDFLHANGVAVGFVLSNFSQPLLSVPTSAGFGISAYRGLGLVGIDSEKEEVTVFLDVEASTDVAKEVVQRYCAECWNRGIRPGMYYNHYRVSHHIAAEVIIAEKGILWDSEPQFNVWNNNILGYTQTMPSPILYNNIEYMPQIRQYQNGQNNDTVDYNAANYSGCFLKPPTTKNTNLAQAQFLLSTLRNTLDRINNRAQYTMDDVKSANSAIVSIQELLKDL